MADNYLDPLSWRSAMDALQPQPNYLAPTLKPGPEPTGYEKVFDKIYGLLGGRPENRSVASALATAFDVGTLGMATGAYDGVRYLAKTGNPAPLALALMPGAKIAQPIERAAIKVASKGRDALARVLDDGILASRNEAGHLPPAMPQRAFSDDYRRTPAGHPGSQLQTDIDGRPLTARYIAGRRTVGGPDNPLTAEEIDQIAASITSSVNMVPRSVLPERAVGSYVDRNSAINIADDLAPQSAEIALAHETGHALHSWGNGVGLDASKPDKAARRVYHDLAYGEPAKVKSQIRDPEYYGYKKSEVPGEITAEVIRAYLQNPNYLKTVSPALAKEVRKLNDVKGLRDIIQFNSLGGVGLGGLGAGAFWPRGEDR